MQRSLLVLSLSLLLSASAFSQDRGTIQCEPGINKVPAWTTPGRAYVVEQLTCGQLVSITGLERGYVRIQIGERIGYVDAKYVRLAQVEQRPPAAQLTTPIQQPQPQAQPEPIPARASSPVPPRYPAAGLAEPNPYPRAEFFGGYNFVLLDNNSGNMDGWNLSIAGDINESFGVKTEFSGLYAKNTIYSNIRYSGYSFLAGPQISARGRSVTAFGHVLFGATHLGASAPFLGMRIGASLNAFSMAIGGGLDWHGQRKRAWRIFQADYFPWRAMDGTAQNFRISTGFVARF